MVQENNQNESYLCVWKELEQENGPQGLMAWVFHEEVQPPEFYSSSNQCLKEE